jgi:hypothetical protein
VTKYILKEERFILIQGFRRFCPWSVVLHGDKQNIMAAKACGKGGSHLIVDRKQGTERCQGQNNPKNPPPVTYFLQLHL